METENSRMERWRLLLGGGQADGTGQNLSGKSQDLDRVLDQLYDSGTRKGGLAGSSPKVSRWLGDIRTYFPASVVRVMQKDALNRLGLDQMLLEPELLSAVEPDVHLVATLMSLKNVIPNKTKDTARQVVRTVVEDLQKRLHLPLEV